MLLLVDEQVSDHQSFLTGHPSTRGELARAAQAVLGGAPTARSVSSTCKQGCGGGGGGEGNEGTIGLGFEKSSAVARFPTSLEASRAVSG